jgi:alpha-tubulin suppressor-like RCC1 family protein
MHSLVLATDGSVYAFGDNSSGQLGTGNTQPSPTPVRVPNLSGVVAISASRITSYALQSSGEVRAWGDGSWDQLGVQPPQGSSSTPVAVSGLTNVVGISAGDISAAVVKRDGTVWAWGANLADEVGSRGAYPEQPTPVQVGCVNNITAVGAGSAHTLALASNGVVWAWGSNGSGVLGDGTMTDRAIPVPVTGLPTAKAVAAGNYHSIALASDGNVWTWGDNGLGQLGTGQQPTYSVTPVQVPGLSAVHAIGSGQYHCLAIKLDGTLWTWGGLASGSPHSPTQVQGVFGARAVDGGLDATICIVDAMADLQPHALDFGQVSVGSTSTMQATLTNTGSMAFDVGGAEVDGDLYYSGDFTATSACPSTLSVGQSCTIDVKFTPSARADRHEVLLVRTGAGWITSRLHGTGV